MHLELTFVSFTESVRIVRWRVSLVSGFIYYPDVCVSHVRRHCPNDDTLAGVDSNPTTSYVSFKACVHETLDMSQRWCHKVSYSVNGLLAVEPSYFYFFNISANFYTFVNIINVNKINRENHLIQSLCLFPTVIILTTRRVARRCSGQKASTARAYDSLYSCTNTHIVRAMPMAIKTSQKS